MDHFIYLSCGTHGTTKHQDLRVDILILERVSQKCARILYQSAGLYYLDINHTYSLPALLDMKTTSFCNISSLLAFFVVCILID